MTKKTAAEYLLQAAGKEKRNVSPKNPYKRIGFDANNARLGWVKPPSWQAIETALHKCLNFLKDKDEFLFIGMGGSINGIKTVASLKKNSEIYAVDSLDPQALGDVLSRIRYVDKIAVIPISKSGTTKETQLLAKTLRVILGKNAPKQFLWLIDPVSGSKLDTLGWSSFRRLPIQVDARCDIGGRFTGPHTLIFFLPLLLILDKDIEKVRTLYEQYLALQPQLTAEALSFATKYKNVDNAYFSFSVESRVYNSFRTWATQLFQESLGSKKTGFFAKTLITSGKNNSSSFIPIQVTIASNNPIVTIMCQMYYLQNVVAFLAYFKKINFVNQPCVETYKKKMKTLDRSAVEEPPAYELPRILTTVKKNIKRYHKFIEIVLYFYPDENTIKKIARAFEKKFGSRCVFVFIGSDWNHHSYQAAYKDKQTFYVLLTKASYLTNPKLAPECLKENIQTLKLISFATYLTLKNHALYLALKS